MRVYRLASARYPANNSEGARIAGGRWNEVGTAVIYTSTTLSLAALEVLARDRLISAYYRAINIDIPDSVVIESVDISSLGPDWHAKSSMPRTAAMGTAWVTSLRTAVLRVPSAVIRTEFNYILNPAHWQFGDIVFDVPAKWHGQRAVPAGRAIRALLETSCQKIAIEPIEV